MFFDTRLTEHMYKQSLKLTYFRLYSFTKVARSDVGYNLFSVCCLKCILYMPFQLSQLYQVFLDASRSLARNQYDFSFQANLQCMTRMRILQGYVKGKGTEKSFVDLIITLDKLYMD